MDLQKIYEDYQQSAYDKLSNEIDTTIKNDSNNFDLSTKSISKEEIKENFKETKEYLDPNLLDNENHLDKAMVAYRKATNDFNPEIKQSADKSVEQGQNTDKEVEVDKSASKNKENPMSDNLKDTINKITQKYSDVKPSKKVPPAWKSLARMANDLNKMRKEKRDFKKNFPEAFSKQANLDNSKLYKMRTNRKASKLKRIDKKIANTAAEVMHNTKKLNSTNAADINSKNEKLMNKIDELTERKEKKENKKVWEGIKYESQNAAVKGFDSIVKFAKNRIEGAKAKMAAMENSIALQADKSRDYLERLENAKNPKKDVQKQVSNEFSEAEQLVEKTETKTVTKTVETTVDQTKEAVKDNELSLSLTVV